MERKAYLRGLKANEFEGLKSGLNRLLKSPLVRSRL
jgi:hypothetical protein